MAVGLIALLDDIAAIAKVAAASLDDVAGQAAKAGAKAAGVVIDDAAVTPRYVVGFAAERELPIVWRIALGSLKNKLLVLLPAALALSWFAPWTITPLLMLGGAYLCYEGTEKVYEALFPHKAHGHEEKAATAGADATALEERKIAGAIKTDFILSAEIMVIALKEVVDSSPDAGFITRAAILIVVALFITLAVYGFVAVLVKMDDVGVHLARKNSSFSQKLGHALVAAMPKVLAFISVVGTAAMLWVGGHILLISLDELSTSLSGGIADVLHAPYGWVHHLEEQVHDAAGSVGAVAGWLVNTLLSAVIGVIVGAIVVAIMHVLPHRAGKGDEAAH